MVSSWLQGFLIGTNGVVKFIDSVMPRSPRCDAKHIYGVRMETIIHYMY